LCVFSGSFTKHDVSVVYQQDAFQLVNGLTRLTDGSLVQRASDGWNRFKVFDTVREFMSTVILGEEEVLARLEARHRHADHYCRKAERIAETDSSQLWADLGNFRSAIGFSVEYHRQDLIVRLAKALARTFMEAGLWLDFEGLAAAGYAAGDVLGDRSVSISLLGLEGAIAARSGEEARCRDLWRKRGELSLVVGDKIGAADSFLDVAVQCLQHNEVAEGLECLDKADSMLEVSKPRA